MFPVWLWDTLVAAAYIAGTASVYGAFLAIGMQVKIVRQRRGQ